MTQPVTNPRLFFTVDVEMDCPPYLSTDRGLTEGLPRLLEVFDRLQAPATFFVTGRVAEDYPARISEILACGHELASHGYSHQAFTQLDEEAANEDIRRSVEVLSDFAPITLFRAPYLSFPDQYLPLLIENGIRLDSSQARYKPWSMGAKTTDRLVRLPASMTSSVLRLPPSVRDPWLRRLNDPVVLFVHPWEFVDLRATDLRWDCRAGTGQHALDSVASTLSLFKSRGWRLAKVGDYLADVRSVAA